MEEKLLQELIVKYDEEVEKIVRHYSSQKYVNNSKSYDNQKSIENPIINQLSEKALSLYLKSDLSEEIDFIDNLQKDLVINYKEALKSYLNDFYPLAKEIGFNKDTTHKLASEIFKSAAKNNIKSDILQGVISEIALNQKNIPSEKNSASVLDMQFDKSISKKLLSKSNKAAYSSKDLSGLISSYISNYVRKVAKLPVLSSSNEVIFADASENYESNAFSNNIAAKYITDADLKSKKNTALNFPFSLFQKNIYRRIGMFSPSSFFEMGSYLDLQPKGDLPLITDNAQESMENLLSENVRLTNESIEQADLEQNEVREISQNLYSYSQADIENQIKETMINIFEDFTDLKGFKTVK